MDTTQWAMLIMVAVLVIVLAAGAYWWSRHRRTEQLHDRFGPEYDRAVRDYGGRSKAEAELQHRAERVEKLEIRPLSAPMRDGFAVAWEDAQAEFVDDPARAVDMADELIREVMAARGYPVGSFEQRAADISVQYPEVVRNYRAAHAVSLSSREGRATTDDLRDGFVSYRALFAELLRSDADAAPRESRTRERGRRAS